MMDALVRDRLGYKLGVTHSKAFNTGDGASKPLGVYTVKGDALTLIGRIVEGKIEAR